MRLVTKQSIEAFKQGKPFKNSNTKVLVIGNEVYLQLFDNTIAMRRSDELYITNCGWKTNTTKERLNGLDGVHIRQVKGKWYLNGEEWDGSYIQIK